MTERRYASKKDREYLNTWGYTKTPYELCKELNLSKIVIERYLQEANIALDTSKEDMFNKIRGELYKKHFWKSELPKQLTKNEITFFEEQWIDYISQFGGDILTSEEFELKDLIMQDILKIRELSESKELRGRRDKYSRMLGEELGKKSKDRDTINSLESRISQLSENILSREKAFKELVSQQDKIRKNLTKIRTQRTEDIDKAKIDFSASVKILETNIREREREATQAEILKKAMHKSYEDLGGYKKFANDQLDRPILNSDTVLKE